MLLRLFLAPLLAFAVCTPADAAPRYRGVQLGQSLDDQDLVDLSAWKANVARYQLHWISFAAADASDEASYNVWLDSALDTFASRLPILEQQGVKVILNLHTPPGGFTRRDEQATHRLFTEQWAQDAFIRAWEKIATRFKDSTGIWAYDLLNEPAEYTKPAAPLKDWNALGAQAAAVVRAIDPTRTLIMGPRYGNPKYMNRLKPLKMKNVLYTIHFYEPFKFLHQGVYGHPTGVKYPSKKWDKNVLLKKLEKVDAFQKKYKAKIFVGEFSTSRIAPGTSGAKYLKDILSIFEKKKWHWAYHCYRDEIFWSVEHGSNLDDHSPSPTPTDRYEVLLKYLAKNG